MSLQSTYLVHAAGTTATLSIVGQGSYVSCGPVRDFLAGIENRSGRLDLVVDFARCTGLDSTILGLFTRTALSFSGKAPVGRVIFVNLDGRNLEVVKNLGLHHIVEVADTSVPGSISGHQVLPTRMCDNEGMLIAHEALIKASPANEAKFHDVVEALRSQL